MSVTLGFDVHGTLIDTHGVVSKPQEQVGAKAKAFSQTWRDKQLENFCSNGSSAAVEELLEGVGIRELLLGVISAEDVRSFKPNLAVYRHFLRESDASANDP